VCVVACIHVHVHVRMSVRVCVLIYERIHECTYIPCTFRVLDPAQWGTWRYPGSRE
jgi:hypothetical protein